jgi:hypothetical protein
MAGRKIASLYAEISGDNSKLKTSLNDSKSAMSGFAGTLRSIGGALAAAGVFKFLTDELSSTVQAALRAETVMKTTESTLAATGRSASISAVQISSLATAESRLTSIDDETVQSGVNMLLTFRQIGTTELPRATRAVEDMAVFMAKGDTSMVDLQGSAIQLGKALSDPIAGLTALKRVGVTFSDEQKAQIQNFVQINDLAGAQGVILKELENEFGGMAETMGNTAAGKINKAKTAIENLKEAMGGNLLPTIGDVSQGVANQINVMMDLDTLLERGAISTGEYEQQTRGLRYGFVNLGDAAQFAKERMEKLDAYTATGQLNTGAVDGLIQRMGELKTTMDQASAAVDALGVSFVGMSTKEAGGEALKNLDTAMKNGVISQQDYDAAFKNIEVTMMGATGVQAETYLKIRDTNAAFQDGKVKVDDYINSLKGAGTTLDKLNEKTLPIPGHAAPTGAAVGSDYYKTGMGVAGVVPGPTLPSDAPQKLNDVAKATENLAKSKATATEQHPAYAATVQDLILTTGIMSASQTVAAGKVAITNENFSTGIAALATTTDLTVTLGKALDKLHDVSIKVNISQSGSLPNNSAGGSSGHVWKNPTGEKMAAGGAFDVPSGYNHDNYIVGVQSGEHVEVTPVGAIKKGGSGLTIYGDVYNIVPPNASTVSTMLQEFSR